MQQRIELKCRKGFTFLSEGLAGFWQCESLDSLLPISRCITELGEFISK